LHIPNRGFCDPPNTILDNFSVARIVILAKPTILKEMDDGK
jgi:hypothetical protein